jgi:hypothetical protein
MGKLRIPGLIISDRYLGLKRDFAPIALRRKKEDVHLIEQLARPMSTYFIRLTSKSTNEREETRRATFPAAGRGVSK